MPGPALDPIDLAARLCSRICHDIISPVGAIMNGLEVLDEDKDAEMRGLALDLIKKSAIQASARLQFCRLAFGAGPPGGSLDQSEAERVARNFFDGERAELRWSSAASAIPRAEVKLILNLCLVAAAAIPRGGVIEVGVNGAGESPRMIISAKGVNARLSGHLPLLLAGKPECVPSTPSDVQAYYAALVASSANMALTLTAESGRITIEAAPLGTAAKCEPLAPLDQGDELMTERRT